jgi:hypothetical protein
MAITKSSLCKVENIFNARMQGVVGSLSWLASLHQKLIGTLSG